MLHAARPRLHDVLPFHLGNTPTCHAASQLLFRLGEDVLLFFEGELYYSREPRLGLDPLLAGMELRDLWKPSLNPSNYVRLSPVLHEVPLKQCNLVMRP